MKSAVVVGIFVLVACLSLQANAGEARGTTDNCNNKPDGVANTCHLFVCDEQTGEYTVQSCSVGVVRCPEGTVQEYLPEDLSKPYPECCARPHCKTI